MSTLDLSRGRWAFVATQVAALVLFFVFAWLFGSLAIALRADAIGFAGLSPTRVLWQFLAALATMILLHEGVHGLFFWLLTGERPRFGFKGAYAYAAAPDWYIPRNQYLLVGLAPLVVLSTAGTLFLALVPAPALFLVLAITVLNAAGSVGDLTMTAWTIVRPKSVLVRDTGDAITVYIKHET